MNKTPMATFPKTAYAPPEAGIRCDCCFRDYTESNDEGGFIEGTTTFCPECAPGALLTIQRFGDESLIRDRAEPGESFADFVRRTRAAFALPLPPPSAEPETEP